MPYSTSVFGDVSFSSLPVRLQLCFLLCLNYYFFSFPNISSPFLQPFNLLAPLFIKDVFLCSHCVKKAEKITF